MQRSHVTLREEAAFISADKLDHYENVILLAPPGALALKNLPYEEVLHTRLQREKKIGDTSGLFCTDLPNATGTRLSLARITPAQTSFELLTLGRQLVGMHRPQAPHSLAIACYGLAPELAERAVEAVIAAALAADFPLPNFKHKAPATNPLKSLHVYGIKTTQGYRRTFASAKGNNLARYLTALPPNALTPALYRRQVAKLAREFGWKSEFLDEKKLRARAAGAFLAVTQGSPERDAGILHLRYTPKKKTGTAPLALVGKGICYDTGGTNLKSAKNMFGMHEDMQGSAVALGTLLALTELQVDFPVDCWLALAQNHIGPKAYKQNDVVRAANGTSIEIMHTDAEGRMVLADTLVFASKLQPQLIVDYATLTGACIAALGTRYSGATAHPPHLIPPVIEAGWQSGERVWPFPLDNDYADELKSDIADIKQCSEKNEADQILAALFLKRFISGDPHWVHVDLAAGNHKGGLAHIPSDVTGFGIRFTLSLLLDQQLLVAPKAKKSA